ncbi:hypothetical protein KR51_00024400 [Rubidibacter lacunae KORDI 51-2]|uniref:DUF7734 domain-containing protein n=1 Tax=Rubidibacter lacunae KORDI 51-2 TaxID=582515 RepID=U5DMU7_9CHRO|nr:hypothetical protein [Rubidibacter lacunae]ERN41020.1 hypothetical protein KR51_00024400 [Rubidibacter lacunae KORDI 51-2]
MSATWGRRLEAYTLACPQEVLLVTATIEGDRDEIAVFKGFSSSLVRSTAFDPDVPVLPESAEILSIDRVASPYVPANPHYIERGLSLSQMEARLQAVGV